MLPAEPPPTMTKSYPPATTQSMPPRRRSANARRCVVRNPQLAFAPLAKEHPAEGRPRRRGRNRTMLRIFYVTDIHGSEICWRKFLNAGPFYGANVVVVGGDITGKAMVPIVERASGRWETTMFDQHVVLDSEDAVRDVETKVLNRGYYPIRVSEEEYRHMQEDEDAVDKRFKEVMLEGTGGWIAMGDDK